MHEASLGQTLVDYLTGEARERTTYEDLRQALARFLVEERGHAKASLRARYPVSYEVNAERLQREADMAVFSAAEELRLLVLFCPGQVHTYVREAVSMARLALPLPSPLVAVTDMREAELIGTQGGNVLARGLFALPAPHELEALALANPVHPPSREQREKESRILHAYTGFLKTCCSVTGPLL